jgi:hypothetical protein
MTSPDTPVYGPRLVATADLERSLTNDAGPLDMGLALWAIDVVSAKAVELTGRAWLVPDDVPAGARATMGVAARRLYTNPDRYTREADGSYSYGLDPSVTTADIFTAPEAASLRTYAVRAPRVRGLGTVSTYRGDVGEPRTVRVPDGTAEGFPWYNVDDPYRWA